MTVVVALAHKGAVTMGADRLAVSGGGVMVPFTKVWVQQKHGLKWLFGMSGTASFTQAVQEQMEFPPNPPGENLYAYLASVWLPLMRDKLLKRNELFDKDGDVKNGAAMLIGVRGQIFRLAPFSIHRVDQSFDAIGSGEGAAYGALYALEKLQSRLTPKEKIRLAIKAADMRYNTVGGKYDIISA